MSETLSLAGRNLVQVGLVCSDLDRARAFYRDVLGLPLLFEAAGMLFFQLEGLRLMVGSNVKPGTPIGGAILYFNAPDIDRLGEALERRGVTFTGAAQIVQRTETHELRLREFFDPDGNALALMGMVARG
ncbi:MAG: VOC family protein [Alphaproteobacteria bacterium]|nr:VOC family protein [Alphaproteobacteria bacterium]MBV9692580.1 VOC family protein [Alphaproteobacteria bacterium]